MPKAPPPNPSGVSLTSIDGVQYRAPARSTPRQRLRRKALIALTLAAGLVYLAWRAAFTLGTGTEVLNVTLFAAEVVLYLQVALLAYLTWDEAPEAPFALQQGLSVDVFITTYNEPDEIVRATALGALAMDYPHRVVILDDGRRESIRALAREIGCDYLARSDNKHAKAGNINNALAHSTADFVAVFDADHVPQADFLTRTLGYFVDPTLALVQTPQDYYNLTSVQHVSTQGPGKRDHWHEQRIFFDLIQPTKNRTNSAFWCGSCAVLRRSAIDSVGGMAVDSVIEDLLTTQRMHATGWRTYYNPTTLAYGIAPDDAPAFRTQRLRWARGAMQILRSRDNPLIAKGLSFSQRLSYFSSVSTYFDAHLRLFLMLVPILVPLTGWVPLDIDPRLYAAMFLPYCIANMTLAALNQGGVGNLLRQERFTLAKMLISIEASAILVFGARGLGFAVTPKRGEGGVIPEAKGVIALTTLAIVSGIVGALGLAGYGPAAGLATWLLGGSIIWNTINAALLASSLPLLSTRVLKRNAYRFPWRIPVAYRNERTGEQFAGATRDLSWAGLSLTGDARVGDNLRIVLKPQGQKTIRLAGTVRSIVAHRSRLGVSLERSDRAALDRLVLAITTEGARLQDQMESQRWATVDRETQPVRRRAG